MSNKPLGALNNWIKSEGSIWHIKKKEKNKTFFALIFTRLLSCSPNLSFSSIFFH